MLQLITAVFLLLSACTKENIHPQENQDLAMSPPLESELSIDVVDLIDIVNDTITYLALGDSYTIGQSVAAEGRWPVQLAERLSQFPELVVLPPTILATTGWTTTNLSQAMTNNGLDDQHFDLVSLLIGVNNQYQNLSIDAYAIEYAALLERAINIAGDSSKVFVVSIPDYGYTPFGQSNQTNISAALEQFNQVCYNITVERGVKHYNITPISQEWPDTPGLVANDGLHPSAVQYGLWVESFYQQVLDQIR